MRIWENRGAGTIRFTQKEDKGAAKGFIVPRKRPGLARDSGPLVLLLKLRFALLRRFVFTLILWLERRDGDRRGNFPARRSPIQLRRRHL
jgi:hypothetical protein